MQARGVRDNSRPVDWRWQRAQELIKHRTERQDKDDDALVAKAVKFLRRYISQTGTGRKKLKDPLRAEKFLRKDYPHIVRANHIKISMESSRYIIEAMVLAQMTPQSIADETGYRPKDIEMYEAMFFDVRSRLHMPFFLAKNVLARFHKRQFDDTDNDVVWKWIAFRYGAAMLRLFVTHEGDENVLAQLEDALMAELNHNGYVASITRRINNFTAADVVNEAPAVKKLTAQVSAPPDKLTDKDEQLKAMLESMKYSVRSSMDVPPSSSEFRQGDGLKRLAARSESGKTIDVKESTDEQPAGKKPQRKAG
jgi:hypothetical protein